MKIAKVMHRERSRGLRVGTFLLALLIGPLLTATYALVPWGLDDIPFSVGWVFSYQGKNYESRLPRNAILASPAWSPEQPLPLSASNAIAVARTQVTAFASETTNWFARQVQLLCVNPLGRTQRWYYAINFFDLQNPKANQIIVCVDLSGHPGTITRQVLQPESRPVDTDTK